MRGSDQPYAVAVEEVLVSEESVIVEEDAVVIVHDAVIEEFDGIIEESELAEDEGEIVIEEAILAGEEVYVLEETNAAYAAEKKPMSIAEQTQKHEQQRKDFAETIASQMVSGLPENIQVKLLPKTVELLLTSRDNLNVTGAQAHIDACIAEWSELPGLTHLKGWTAAANAGA